MTTALNKLMKKPKLQVEDPQPQHRNVQRADIPPAHGYALVVDGRFKTEFVEEGAVKKAAAELLAKYPMLQVEIYDAASKSRTSVKS
jgi:hypothetical protein